jgi:hypothetical protein
MQAAHQHLLGGMVLTLVASVLATGTNSWHEAATTPFGKYVSPLPLRIIFRTRLPECVKCFAELDASVDCVNDAMGGGDSIHVIALVAGRRQADVVAFRNVVQWKGDALLETDSLARKWGLLKSDRFVVLGITDTVVGRISDRDDSADWCWKLVQILRGLDSSLHAPD